MNFYSTLFSYADDTSLICSANNYNSLNFRIEADLNKLSQWLNMNRLIINRDKTKGILFSYRSSAPIISYRDNLILKCHKHSCIYNCRCVNIQVVDHVKYLGLLVDCELKWNIHIDNLTKKLQKINYNLYYIRQYVRMEDMLSLYYSWFQSVVSYGIIHWGGTFHNILEPINMSQRMVLRTICKIKKFDSISYKFKELRVMTIQELYCYKVLTFLRQNLTIFEVNLPLRELRSADNLQFTIPFYTKEISRRQAYFKAITLYNSNSDKLNITASKQSFKNSLKNMILKERIVAS